MLASTRAPWRLSRHSAPMWRIQLKNRALTTAWAPQFRQMAEAAVFGGFFHFGTTTWLDLAEFRLTGGNRGWTKPGGRESAKYDKGEQSDRLGNQEWRLGLGRRQRREDRNFLE